MPSPKREGEVTTVQLDLGNMANDIGRIKEAPVCVDETLRKEAMSTEQLSKMCFPLELPSETQSAIEAGHRNQEASVVSSSSSTASRESAYISDAEGCISKVQVTPVRLERRQSEMINNKVTTQKCSRNGRQTQRWYTDPETQRRYRMVTGCVPIVEGGKILLISASRKAEWILPKGGWELDEGIEESAIRECYEEAGVLGTLGPCLTEVEYETRKAKKRRLELEEVQRMAKIVRDAHIQSAPEGEGQSCEKTEQTNKATSAPSSKSSDETSSVSSESSSTYSHVRMTLFPLYVSEVKGDWPESGRFRKAVDIDEAIKLCESRPEFHKVLIEVKERNLHHLHEDHDAPVKITDR